MNLPPRSGRRARLFLYSKADCPLCDEALPGVRTLARRYDLELVEVDIEASSPDVLQRHRYRIPVLALEETELAWGRFAPAEVASRLEGLLSQRR